MQALESYLSQLHADAEEQSRSNHTLLDPTAVVQQMIHVSFHDIRDDDVGLCSSLLLSSEHNLLRFLEETVQINDRLFAKAREDILKFLHEYIKFLGRRVQDHALAIKVLFRRDSNNMVKQATFNPLIKLLELKLPVLTSERLGVKELTETYMKEFVTGKSSQTVKGSILKLLGIMSEYFPEILREKASQLLPLMVESLNKEFKSQKPEMQVIAGALRGLSSYLIHFGAEFTASAKNLQMLYRYMSLALEPLPNMTRYNIPKAGLKLLSTHAGVFRQYLTEDSEKMYGRIAPLCQHQNKKLRDHALAALDAFLGQVSSELVSTQRDPASNRETFKFFVRKFFAVLESPTGSVKEVSIAIRGLGKFAAPIRSYMGSQELRKTLHKLLQFSERHYAASSDAEQVEDLIHHLSSFLQAFAAMLFYVSDVDDSFLDHLDDLFVAIFWLYPQLFEGQRYVQHKAIAQLFLALHSKGSALATLASRVIFKGLAYTCSQPRSSFAPTGVGQREKKHFEYYTLWKRLIYVSPKADPEFPASELTKLNSVLYDQLIQSIIKILQKLDLSYKTAPHEGRADEKVGANIIATVQRDHEIFVNLVDFCRLILPKTQPELFPRWAYLFCREVIEHANRFPLVSGFYKLLAVAIKVCESQKYYDGINPAALQEVQDNDEMSVDDPDNKRTCFILSSKFVREVLVRLQQYKDELLASCLHLVLSVPRVFTPVSALVPSMQTAFKIGLTYYPLAHLGLSAVEYWQQTDSAAIAPHLGSILPYLGDYLRVKSTDTTSGGGTKEEEETKVKMTSKKIGEIKAQDVKDPTMELQLRIIRLLGRLGGANAHLTDQQSAAQRDTALDPTLRVRFGLPFLDMRPDLYLDHFLPRILELAQGASDRQAKVAAGELLHSIVLFMIGQNSQSPKSAEGPTPFFRLYQAVFPCLVALAADVENVTRQLFEPLVFQLIHWFTKNSQSENAETMALLDAIIDAAGSAADTALREYAAKALAEFLRWSLKHISKKQAEKNAFNVKSLLKRLYSLAHHPNPQKRLGFAATLSHMYPIIREEDAVIDAFALEILHNCLEGNARVTLASGVSMRIKDLANLPPMFECAPPSAHLPRPVPKECIKLVFSDGRTLICTPDHQIMTSNGWVRAGRLVTGVSRVVLGPDAPLYDPAEDDPMHLAAFTLLLPSVGITLSMLHPQHVARAHAFARILGYFLTNSTMSYNDVSNTYTGSLCMGHMFDAERAVADIQLVVGVALSICPNGNTFNVHLPANLLRDLHEILGIPYGKRIFSASSLPDFLMQPTCPKSLVREFLGGMFGGDGSAPIPLAKSGWSSIRLSMCKVPLSLGNCSYHSQASEYTASIKHVFGQVKALLERFGITGLTEWELRDVTDNHPNSLERPGVRVHLGVLVLPTEHLYAFHEHVGFRLCGHKQQRLAVAAAYYRTKNYSREQRQRFMRRVQELTGYLTAPFGPDGCRILNMSMAKAYAQTKAEMKQTEVYINESIAIPKKSAIWDAFTGKTSIETSGSKCSDCPHRWLAAADASDFFAKEQESGKRKAQYALSRDTDGFSTWTAVFMGSKPAGKQLVYDLSVPRTHNFVAEGVTVHNCIFSLRLAHADDDSLGTAEKIVGVIGQYSHAISKSAALLNKANEARRQHADLAHFVEWVFKETGRTESRCRAECMVIFSLLAPLVPGAKSPAAWLMRYKPAALMQIFEPAELKILSANKFSLDDLNGFYSALLTSLDCYKWVLGEGLLMPDAVFSPRDGKLIPAVESLLKHFLFISSSSPLFATLTPAELERHQRGKSRLCVRLLEFMHLIRSKFAAFRGIDQLFAEPCFNLALTALVHPTRLGCPPNDTHAPALLVAAAYSLLSDLRSAGQRDQNKLRDAIARTLSATGTDLRAVSFRAAEFHLADSATLIGAYNALRELGFLPAELQSRALGSQLVHGIFDNAEQYSPLQLTAASDALHFALSLSLDAQSLLDLLAEEAPVEERRAQPAELSLPPAPAAPASAAAAKAKAPPKPTQRLITKGSSFYALFRSVLVEHVQTNWKSLGKLVFAMLHKSNVMLRILLDVLDRLTRAEQADVRSFLSQLPNFLPQLSMWMGPSSSPEQKENLLAILKRVVKLDPEFVAQSDQSFGIVKEAFIVFLGRDASLAFKNETLELLPFMLSLPRASLNVVKEKLADMVINDFPLRSRDLPKNSTAYTEYIACLDKLLTALVASRSLVLLEALYPILREPDHAYRTEIQRFLQQFLGRLDDVLAREAFELCFRVFSDKRLQDELRSAIVNELLIPLLLSPALTLESALSLFGARLGELVKSVQQMPNKQQAQAMSADEQRTLVMEKVCIFALLEAMYQRVPAASIREDLNKVHATSLKIEHPKGNELTTAVMRAAHAVKMEPQQLELVPKTIYRQLQCRAYNTLATVVIGTQTKEDFFTFFCFKESRDKGELLYDNIVDTDAPWKFEVETHFPLARKAVDQLRQPQPGDPTQRKGISTAYLADSSLSVDAAHMSEVLERFSAAQERVAAASANEEVVIPRPGDLKDPSGSDPGKPREEEIELDTVNSSPCMTTMLRLIDHLMQRFGRGYDPHDMPKWMEELYMKISDRPHPNVAAFIAKLLVNRPQVFEPYAQRYWLKPLLELAMSFKDLNYFVRDICILALQWGVRPDDTMCTKFANTLARLVPYGDRSILRANIDLFRIFFSRWRGHFTLDSRQLLEFISFDPQHAHSKLYRTTGMQLLGLMLANGMPIYENNADKDVSEFKFYERLTENLQSSSKELYQAASEVSGLLLSYHATRHNVQNSTFEQLLKEKLAAAFTKMEYDRVLQCLYCIGQHYAPFLDQFFLRIFEVLRKMVGLFRSMTLELILWRADNIPDLFKRLRPFLGDAERLGLLNQRDEPSQLMTLKILLKLLKKLDAKEVQTFLDLLYSTFVGHPAEDCRDLYYEILIWIYDNMEELRSEKLTLHLLRGLSDASDKINAKMYTFWDSTSRLSEHTVERLQQTLSLLYAPEVEDAWLKFSTLLLLNLTRRNSEYNRQLFDALTDASFTEYRIDTSSYQRSLPMTPMFASQSFDPELLPEMQSSQSDQQPLYSIGGSGSSQSAIAPTGRTTLATEAVPRHGSPQPATHASHAGSTFKKPHSEVPTRRLVVPQLFVAAPRDPQQQQSVANIDSEVRLRRRFEKGVDEDYFFRRSQLKKKMRAQQEERMRDARQNKVQVIREYRKGDLPDVQIKPKDLIEPLQALSMRDPVLSRLAYAHIFISIYQHLGDRDQKAFRASVRELFQRVLERSLCTAPFIGTIQRICFEEPELLRASALIGTTSYKSLNFHTGIMLLEKQILHSKGAAVDQAALKKKKLGTQPDSLGHGDDAWVHLAKLYEALGEEDILLGVYEKHIARTDLTKRALEAQLRNDYASAMKLFVEALAKVDKKEPFEGVQPSTLEVDVWESGRLESLVQLARWEELADNTLHEIGGNEHLDNVWDPRHTDPFLRYFIMSHVKIRDRYPTLFKFIDSANASQRNILQALYSPELAVAELARDDLDLLRHYLLRSYTAFLTKWTSLHPLAAAGRHATLQPLQKLVEMEDFLTFVQDAPRLQNNAAAAELLQTWEQRWPSSSLDTMKIWDDVMHNRSLMLDKLVERRTFFGGPQGDVAMAEAGDTVGGGVEELKQALLTSKSKMYLSVARGARKQGNYYVADQYMRLCLKASKDKQAFASIHALVKLFYLRACKTDVAEEKAEKLCKALKFMESKRNEEYLQDVKNLARFRALEGELYRELAHVCDSAGDVDSVRAALKSSAVAGSDAAPDAVQERLYKCAHEAFGRVLEGLRASDGVRDSTIAKAHVKLALLSDALLRQQEVRSKRTASPALVEAVIGNVFEGMQRLSSAARDRFPRLLELIAQYPDTAARFTRMAKSVPSWMFIRWISQMMAVLDKPEGAAVVPILIEIAKSYPQALYYPFRISSENLGPKGQVVIEPLSRLLSNQLLDSFVHALENLTHPEHRWKDWQEAIRAALQSGNEAKTRELWHNVYADVFDPKDTRNGSYNQKFAKEWGKHMCALLGQDGSKLVRMTHDGFISAMADTNKKINAGLRATSHMKLNEFSDWLAEYEQSDQLGAQFIEIPGQYSGLCKPQPELHIRISSFEPSLLVMSSLRKPKRLKIHGSDEREHPWLVKGGEDLRLDQRVQQLFSVMNEIFLQDPHCSKRRLALKTYEVVPMTNKVGIIQWLSNTQPIKELIEEQLAKDENKPVREASILKISAASVHDTWLRSFLDPAKRATATGNDPYYAMFEKATREHTVTKVDNQHALVRWNLLREAIFRLSSSPEAYLALRSQFAKTLANFNICSYILGIGDRHLENFLLDLKKGGLVGIDFGHAFGSATQILPIPELMPFRLTRQLTGFLQPLDSDGLLKHNMIHTLRALRENRDVLLNTMNVFVNEPLLDWEKYARRLAREQSAAEHLAATFPKKKIDIAKRKLDGDNPAFITLTELTESTIQSRSCYHAIKEIVAGYKEHNVRARVGRKCASVKEQVECLVDQATDPNILGRTWAGWAAWI